MSDHPRERLRARLTALTLASTALSLCLAACATFQNTPEQDLALSRWAACSARNNGVLLSRVQLDGRIFFSYTGPSQREPVLECLRLAGKDGPALPEAVAEPRPGGGSGGGGA